ncbi:hypothetical protein [Paraburkholderia sp. J63]|uniref:hypothetical protein n=1 Tax=Paraburkholderia sp. J63 TaxID=2805434 RepID=UPI002ABD8C34|nr:hypothetical protein [Paraburkholderia sp. J63]
MPFGAALHISIALRFAPKSGLILLHALLWGVHCTAFASCSFGTTPYSISTQFLFSAPYDARDRYFTPPRMTLRARTLGESV